MFAANASLRIPFDPVTLSYVLALRGVRGRLPVEPFTYAEIGCGAAERLILLAACNPEGTFFGFDPSLEALNKAATKAEAYGITNITFSQASATMLKEALENKIIASNSFDYLVHNTINNTAKEDAALLGDCAKLLLRNGGAFAYRYKTYENGVADEHLFQYLTHAMLAEDPKDAEAFAKEWRGLCTLYFAAYPQQSDDFDKALADGKGAQWLRGKVNGTPTESATVSTIKAFADKNISFMGSAKIANNYMELSAPDGAHNLLALRRQHSLYEALKDLAMQSSERVDLWVKEPMQRSDNLVTLFGAFNFGSTEPEERIARTVNFQGRSISFVGPLYDSVLSLATVIPVTMGDLVSHESLQGTDPVTLLNTVHMLVACGVLQPMRSSYQGGVEMDNPKLVGSYNQSLRKTELDFQDYAFASTVTGRPIHFSGMAAIVVQGLDKGGTGNLAALVADELMRLSQHPYLRPLKLDDPEKAVAEALRQIESAYHQSMVRWFSMGILNTGE